MTPATGYGSCDIARERRRDRLNHVVIRFSSKEVNNVLMPVANSQGGSVMRARGAVLLIGFAVAAQAVHAVEMSPEQARRFIIGEMFMISCFDGTQGAGRVYADGSAAGTLRLRGVGPMRSVSLPAGTLKVKSEAVCAALETVPFEPCFNLNRTGDDSFRGWVSGFAFAYCDFTRVGRGRAKIGDAGSRDPGAPLPLDRCAAALHHDRQC